jgi:hypothetical protein
MKNNLFISLLNLLNVRYTKSYVDKLYKEHPYKYSLYGLSQMLHTYRKLKQLKLHNIIVLNDSQMKKIVGGYDDSPYGSGYGDYNNDSDYTKKKKPCDGKQVGGDCEFTDQNGHHYGTCELFLGYVWCHSRGLND